MVEESGSESSGKSGLEEELAKASARLIELEKVVAGKEAEIDGLKREVAGRETEINGRKQTGQEMEKRLKASNDSLTQAVASYKAVVAQANPEVIDELISGDSIASIDESVSRAKELVSKVRRGIESEISLAKVPAGAPERTPPDLSALSPRENIQYAIGKR